MRIAVYGGAFNPIHKGHYFVINQLLENTDVEQVWVMPTYNHNHKDDLSSFEDRLFLINLMIEENEKVIVSLYEKENEVKNGTLVLLNSLKKDYPEHDFYYVIGQDNADSIDTWTNHETLILENKFITVQRRICPAISDKKWYAQQPHNYISIKDCEQSYFSSSMVRRAAKNKKWNAVELMTDKNIMNVIKDKKMFT